ncbi:hypothetical protein V6N12_030364 [Hibiscus sabdariffa]|uniref:Translocase of chloroplast 159/132 membrane anchor domain-containing protein n=1 Tax=Hibiscus sabdariffa TaxID=183260 RepID=A0ABR2C0P7_9ROSI
MMKKMAAAAADQSNYKRQKGRQCPNGKDSAYTLRGETRFSNFRKNKANAGISVTLLSAGVKVEDKLTANKRFQVVMTSQVVAILLLGAVWKHNGRTKITTWTFCHGDLAITCSLRLLLEAPRS